MKLSNKMKKIIAKRLTSATAILAVLVLVFACSKNLFVGTRNEIKIASVESDDSQAGTSVVSTADIVRDSTGIHVKVEANESDGVRRIDVLKDDTSIQVFNYDGSSLSKNEYVHVTIPFGQTSNVKVKVNGIIIKNENVENNRYISNADDLGKFRDAVNGGNSFANQNIDLISDIDLSEVCSSSLGSWVPIGASGTCFAGILNGNFHKIKNLYMHYNNYIYLGFFTRFTSKDVIIKNLIMDNVNVYNGYSAGNQCNFVGAITGGSMGHIINCGVDGGVVEQANSGKYYTGIGGIAGYSYDNSYIICCYNRARLVSTVYGATLPVAGGIAGDGGDSVSATSVINNCYNRGNIRVNTGSTYARAGGLMGNGGSTNTSISNSYNTEQVWIGTGYNGGIIGYAGCVISNDYCTNDTNGRLYYTRSGSSYDSGIYRVAPGVLKTYSNTLGSAYWLDDIYNINDGYPVLRWQVEAATLNARHEYMNIGDTKQLVLDTSTLPFTNDILTWHSYDESIARIDSNGMLTAVGEGYTTIWAEYSQYNIKVMAIINVAKSNAVTYAQTVSGNTRDSGSGKYTIILKEDGSVWSVGSNTYGELGDGTNTTRYEPVQVLIDSNTPLTNVIKIGSGTWSAYAITKDGKVYAWGRNQYGQLGIGGSTNMKYATPVLGLNGNGILEDIVDIAPGRESVAALARDGSVYSWGGNSFGELGNGTTTASNVPVRAKVYEGCISIAQHYRETSALTTKGKVYSWGRGIHYSVGNGSTSDCPTPILMNISNIVEISRGDTFFLGKDVEGKVYSLGCNTNGQLVNGSTSDSASFVEVNLPSSVNGNNKVKQIRAIGYLSLILLQDGTIWTAGDNGNGEASTGGTNTSLTSFVQAKNRDGSFITNAKWIGDEDDNDQDGHKTYIDKDGYVYTVGDNQYGQFGNGATTDSYYYTKMGVPYLNYLKGDIVIKVGEEFLLSKTDFKIEDYNVSIEYNGIEAGNLTYSSDDTCIAVSSNGRIIGASEGYARLKVKDTTNNIENYLVVKVVNDKNEQVEMGNRFSVALRTNGEVWTWGSNTYGELGVGSDVAYVDEPKQIKTLKDIVNIGAGNYHAVALDKDGYVYTWGLNNVGQIGNGETTDLSVPTKINELSNIIKVDAYKNVTVALDKDGNLYAWGENIGKIPQVIHEKVKDISGNIYLKTDRTVRRIDSTFIQNINNVIKFSSNGDYVVALLGNGKVVEADTNGSINILSVNDAVDVSRGNGFTYVLTKDGCLYTYGVGSKGQLGNSTKIDIAIPTKVTASNVEVISAGEGEHGAYATFDGSIYTTGSNDKGQLGHKNIDDKDSFEIVLNVAIESNVEKVVEGIGDTQVVDIGLGITLNLKKDLKENSTSTITIVDDTIASLTKNLDETYNVTGSAYGRTFLNATISGNINGEDRQFATNVEVRIVPEGGITVPQIKSGKDFTIALKSNGKIAAWGGNVNGQLGLGNKTNYDEPQELEELSETVVEIAVGDNHVLALTEEGTIYGWGLNNFGQVGNGTLADQISQATVINIYGNELSKIIRVEANSDNSFAINEDGEVFAWGKDFGSRAVKIAGAENAIDVSTSYYVKADGNVYDMINFERLEIVGKVSTMDEGTDHTVFLTTGGIAYSIGDNTFGQLGVGNTAPIQGGGVAAVRRNETDLFDNIVAIEAGERYTVILTRDGKIYTVGINKNGEQGLEPKVTSDISIPHEIPGISDVMLISAGHNHMVVAKNDGFTYSWGLNKVGQLGNRTIKNSLLPVMVGDYVVRATEKHLVEGKTESKYLKAYVDYFNMIKEDVIPISVQSKNTQVASASIMTDSNAEINAGLSEEEIAKGYKGICVEGVDKGTTNIIITPTINRIPNSTYAGITNVEVLPTTEAEISPMVETKANHTVTLKTNGTVWTYGQNTYGQLGIGTTETEDQPHQVNFGDGAYNFGVGGTSENGTETKIVQIAVGEFHSVALDSEGNVWTWGRNNYMQLGMSVGEFSESPVMVIGIPKVKRIAAGNNSVMAITEDNRLVGWGQNAYGELGNGEVSNKQSPVIIEGMHDVLDIQGGKSHYVVLKTDGKIYTVGSNLYGQLGVDLGDITRTLEFERIDTTQKFSRISSSYSSNIAITVDGQVYAWGQNTYGQLGTGDKANKKQITKVNGVNNIVEPKVGKTHSVLRNYNEELFVGGTNSYGQLGDGTTNNANNFKKCIEIEDVLRITAGNTYTAVMKDDGTVWAWGDYNHGNKSLRSRTNAKVPIQIGSDDTSLDTLEIVVKKSEIRSLVENSDFKFNLIYDDENKTTNYTYTCLNTQIARVNNYGNILGVRSGTTWVKAVDNQTGKVNVAIVRVIENTAGYDTYTAPKVVTGDTYAASLKEDGSIFLWGYNDSEMVDSDVPYNANVVTTYVDLKSGKDHIVALRKDGTVWVAGQNTYGQLGQGNYKSQMKLVQVPNLTEIVKIAAGDNFTVAMDSYGIMYVWGEGYSNKPQVLNTNIRNASYIAAGGQDQIAIVLPSGEVYGFGSTLNGLLDNFDNAVKVEVGNRYFLILDTDGKVFRYANGTLTRVNEATNTVDISSKNNVNIYQNVNERAFVWGANDRGQLGDNTTSGSTIPIVPTNYGTDVFAVTAGNKNTYITDVYGNVYAAGDNQYGQLGNGTKEDTEAESYGQSKVHTLVGDRAFTVEPTSAIMEKGDTEELTVTGNSYNVFKKVAEKNRNDYNFASADSSIIELQTDGEGNFNGSVKAAEVGKTKVIITDKVTNKSQEIERRVVPMEQNRLLSVTANGEEAEAGNPDDELNHIAKYKVQVALDDDQNTATVVIVGKEQADLISLDGGVTSEVGSLSAEVELSETESITSKLITVEATNGTKFIYELEIERLSTNNSIKSITVNGFTAEESEAEENTYEIIVTDITDLTDPDNLIYNQVVVTAEKTGSKVSIKGKTAELSTQSYPTSLERGYVEMPIKITSESGKVKNYTLRIYSKDEMLELQSVEVNGTSSEKQDDGTYRSIIADDISRSSVTATAKYENINVGVNDSLKEPHTVTRTVLTTADESTETIALEAELKVDGVVQTISKNYTLMIYKNKVFSMVQEVQVNGEILEEENNTYIAYVTSSINDANIEITAKDSNYRIELDDANSLENFAVIKTLTQDETTYNFIVTDEGDGSSKAYILKVIRGNTDTRIKKMTVGKNAYVVEAELTDEVVDDKPVYEVKILDKYTNVDITVQTAYKRSKVSINGGPQVTRIAVKDETLTERITELPIQVNTEDGETTKDYILRIIRQNDSTEIDEIKVNDGADISAIKVDDTRYEVDLNNAVTSVDIIGITENDYAKISIDGELQEVHTSTISIDLTQAMTEVEIKVTSEAGNEKTYTLTINTISDDVSLQKITVDGNEATWNGVTGQYEIKVDRDLNNYNVEATTTEEEAKVSVDGTEAVHISSKTVTNALGETTVPILVTAPNTITSKIYILAIIEKSDNSNLGYVKLNGKSIAPDDNGDYYLEVVSSVQSILVEVGAEHNGATIDLESEQRAGVWKDTKVLQTDEEEYEFTITAEAGGTPSGPYKIKIKRLDGNTDIDEITVTYTKGGTDVTVVPTLKEDGSYFLKIPKIDEERVVLSITAKKSTTFVNVLGTEEMQTLEGYVNLTGEETIAPIILTAEDGTTRRTRIALEKLSSNTNLKQYTAVEATKPDDYTIIIDSKVDKLTITAIPEHENATVKLEGTSTYANELRNVEVDITGKTELSVDVLAEDGGTVRTHTVQIVRNYDTGLDSVDVNSNTVTTGSSVNIADSTNADIEITAINDDATIELIKDGVSIATGSGNLTVNQTLGEETVTSYTIRVTGPCPYESFTMEYPLNLRAISTNVNATICIDDLEISKNGDTGFYEAIVTGENHVIRGLAESIYTDVSIDGANYTDIEQIKDVLLSPGQTELYTVTVKAENGDEEEYLVQIYRKNNDVRIDELSFTPIVGSTYGVEEALTQLPSGDYYKKINRHLDDAEIRLKAKHSNAAASINDEAEEQEESTRQVALDLSEEIINIPLKVIAEDGTEKTVNLKIERESNDVMLKTVKEGTKELSLVGESTYNIEVDSKVTSIDFTAVPNHENARVKLDIDTDYSNTLAGVDVNIKGKNSFEILVIAEDNETTKTYTIQIDRTYDASMDKLDVDDDEVKSETTAYEKYVTANEASHTIKVTSKNDDAIITLYDQDDTVLMTGTGTLEFIETALGTAKEYKVVIKGPGDYESFTKEYTLEVKEKSKDATAKLYIDGTELERDEGTGKYRYVTRNTNNTLRVAATNSFATISVNSSVPVQSVYERVHSVQTGTTEELTVVVTSQNGEAMTYEVELVKLSNNVDITSIKVNDKDSMKLSDTLYKNVQLTSETNGNVIITLVDSRASVIATVDGNTYNETTMVDGKKTLTLDAPLSGIGTKTVDIEVTAEDGTVKVYALKIVQNPSNNANVIVNVDGQRAEKLDDSTYKIIVANSLTEAEVNIAAVDRNTVIACGSENGNNITFNQSLSINNDTTTVSFTITAQSGITRACELYIVKERGAGQVGNRNIASIKVNDKESTKVGENLYKNVQLAKERNGAVSIVLEDSSSSIRALVDGNVYDSTTVVGGRKVLEFNTPLSGSGSKTVILEVTGADSTAETVTLNIVQNTNDSTAVSVKVNSLEAEQLDDSTYRIFVNNRLGSSEVNISAEDENTIVASPENTEATGSTITFNKILEAVGDTTIVSFTVTSSSGITKYNDLYIIKESTDNTAKKLYVNGLEINKSTNGRYEAYIDNSVGNPMVKVVTNNEYAYVRIGTYAESRHESEQVVELESERKTSLPITIRSQSGENRVEHLDIYVTFVRANIDEVKVDNIEITDYDAATKTYTAIVENTLEEHEIYVAADNSYMTLEINESIGRGDVTTQMSFEEGEEIRSFPLYITGETGITEVYTIVLAQKSSNTNLKSVKVNDVSLTLDTSKNQYRKSIDKIATKAKIEVETEYPYAKVKVADETPIYGNSGTVWVDLRLDQDEITIPVLVTAADGTTIDTYNIVLTRVASEITGKIITQNAEDKHVATIKIYRSSDHRKLDDELDPREVIANVVTNEDGTYSISVPNADNYDMIIEKEGYLTHTITNVKAVPYDSVSVKDTNIYAGNIIKYTMLSQVSSKGEPIQGEEPKQIEQIEVQDLVALNDNYGEVITDANWLVKHIYDLNEDGVVDRLDRNILKANMNKKAETETWTDPDAPMLGSSMVGTSSLTSGASIGTSGSKKMLSATRMLSAANAEFVSSYGFIKPIACDYTVTSPYGERVHPVTGEVKKHNGIDLSGEHHTEIYAIADGEVTFAGVQNGYGNCIEIKHIVNGETIYSFYAHLSQINVKVRENVVQGQVIALEGGAQTDPGHGTSTGHHLHFEIRTASGTGHAVNPCNYINF